MTALDRADNGFPRKCCECSRTFKGEAWQDYCAECHAENERTSPLNQRWACLTCNVTFKCGTIISGPQGWQCPKCKSTDLHPAEGVRTLPEYEGQVPELKN